jgi:hypothetical protein
MNEKYRKFGKVSREYDTRLAKANSLPAIAELRTWYDYPWNGRWNSEMQDIRSFPLPLAGECIVFKE